MGWLIDFVPQGAFSTVWTTADACILGEVLLAPVGKDQ